MERFRNILVGVDLCDGSRPISHQLSASTRSAVSKALWIAGHTSAKITFLSSLMPCLDLTPAMQQLAMLHGQQSMIDALHENARERMSALVARARSADIRAGEIRTAGTPWLELLREAVTGNYDLVIVGSHSQHALGRLLLGNTGRRLIRKCPCPVWVTSPVEDGQVRRILVPTDYSVTGNESLLLARSLATQFEAEVHVLHAIESGFELQVGERIVSDCDVVEFCSRHRADAERNLDNVITNLGLQNVINPKHRHIAAGPADLMIREAVENLSIDLVVMGTLGRSGISGMVMGNTAEQVLNHLTCSMLAIKPDGFQCPINFPDPCETQETFS